MKTAAIATLGCKVNQVESSSIAEQLTEKGFQIVEFDQPADVYIINTCTVTNRTDYKSRNLIRKAQKQKSVNPQVKIIVTGCYAQKEIAEIRELGNIDLIVDNQAKIDLDLWLENDQYQFRDIMHAEAMPWKPVKTMHERTRAFLKIQDGCDYYCSYCAVPYGRGPSRSLSFREVIEQAELLTGNGYQEIVLSGVNLGLYHDKTTDKKLSDAIQVMVEKNKLKLLRLSAIEPDLWENDLIEVIQSSEKVCPHFHVPVQSGCDSVLQSMGRKYSVSLVQNLIWKLNEIKPDCAIGLDIISGFPGETEAEHQKTLEFIKEAEISYLHVFGYSKRKGTPATLLSNQNNGKVIKQRVAELTTLSNIKKEECRKKLISKGIKLRGIVETVANGLGSSLSDHYLRIYSGKDDTNENDYTEGIADRKHKDGILIKTVDSF